jgi:hypothetical protein
VVDFVVVGSVTGMPPRRVFRHTWRHSNYTLINSRRKDLRRLNSEVISSRSGSRYVVGDINFVEYFEDGHNATTLRT